MANEKQERRREKTKAARAELRVAVNRAGGPSKVARKMGTRVSHLGNILSGERGLGPETANRLRKAIRVRQQVLIDLLAPDIDAPLPGGAADAVGAQAVGDAP